VTECTCKQPLCPKCEGPLEITESDGLWCPKGCYESEFDLWDAIQKRELAIWRSRGQV